MIKNITNLGDTALYCDFGDEVNSEINSNVISVFNILKDEKIEGIVNLAPSYNKLIVSFDLDVINYQKVIDLSYGTILLSIPSFAFFIILPILLKMKQNFAISIIISIIGTSMLYFIFIYLLKKFGISI